MKLSNAEPLLFEPLRAGLLLSLRNFYKVELDEAQRSLFMPHPDSRVLSYPLYAAMLLQQFSGRAWYCLALSGGRPLGLILLRRFISSSAELGIAVASAHQGQGLGGRLMEEILAEARRRNLKTLHLTHVPGNAPAEKLYRRYGFRPNGDLSVRLLLGGTRIENRMVLEL
ncbi:MAG: GNAT family N-acetyltransferase [Planctomycetes bacterium]|nr:GNAT family N-acetyltransferase [Planctomycetota bacterium]